MSARIRSITQARDHLGLFGPWEPDPDTAAPRPDFEEWIAEGLLVLGFVEFANKHVRRAVYHGMVPNDDKAGVPLKSLFENWLVRARSGRAELVRSAEAKDVDAFRTALDRVERYVADWPPPVRSELMAAFNAEMTDEEAADTAAILKAGLPPGTPDPQDATAPGDASMIR